MELPTSDARDGSDEHGLTWTGALVASGVPTAGLAFSHVVNGPPTGSNDWALVVSTAMFAGVVGDKMAGQAFDTVFGITTMLLVVELPAYRVGLNHPRRGSGVGSPH